MQGEPKILPCPNCGSAPDVGLCTPWPRGAGPRPWYAGCYRGGDDEHFVGANGDTRDEAIENWNIKADRSPSPTEGEGNV